MCVIVCVCVYNIQIMCVKIVYIYSNYIYIWSLFFIKLNAYISAKRLGKDWGKLSVKYFVHIKTKDRNEYRTCRTIYCKIKRQKM